MRFLEFLTVLMSDLFDTDKIFPVPSLSLLSLLRHMMVLICPPIETKIITDLLRQIRNILENWFTTITDTKTSVPTVDVKFVGKR